MTIFQNSLKLLSMIRVLKKIRGHMLGLMARRRVESFIGGIEIGLLQLSRPMKPFLRWDWWGTLTTNTDTYANL
jgi:hypothetical protein